MTLSSLLILNKTGTRRLNRMALPAVLALTLMSGCGSQNEDAATGTGTSARASATKVQQAAAKDPCSLLSPAVVADLFSVPVAEVKRIAVASTCQYDWKAGSDRLQAALTVQHVGQNAAEAISRFDSGTRSLSAGEVSDAFSRIDAELEKRGQKSAGTDAVSGAMGAGGGRAITFEDFSGVGDRARFNPGQGELHVVYGNLYFSVSAYHGPKMSMPGGASLQDLPAITADWQRETTPQRKAAAEKVAKAVLANL